MIIDESLRRSDKPVRVVIADDHEVMRYLLTRRLKLVLDGSISIVAEAPDGASAVRAVQHLQPDVVILDLHMPYLTGIEAAREIARRSPTTAIFGWTTADDEPTRDTMLRAGARQVFIKGAAFEPMIWAILQVSDRGDPEPTSSAA